MNVQVTHVVIHDPEQVRGIIAEAVKIADEHEGDGVSWSSIFREACALLGQRHSVALADQPVPINLAALNNGAFGPPR